MTEEKRQRLIEECEPPASSLMDHAACQHDLMLINHTDLTVLKM